MFILANVFSELLHSKTHKFSTQLTENQHKQPKHVCGPTTIGSKFAKIKPPCEKAKMAFSTRFFMFCKEGVHSKVKDGH